MEAFLSNYVNQITFWGFVVTIVGFGLTIWQLLSVGTKVKAVENATRTRIENTLTLVVVVEIIQLISSIHDNLQSEEWEKATYKLSNLHMSLSGITSHPIVKGNARDDFYKCVTQISLDLGILRNYKHDKPSAKQVQSMNRNLDVLLENLKLVEQKLK